VKQTQASYEQARLLLCELGIYIRASVCSVRRYGSEKLSRVSAVTASDTIYAIDRISEKAIFRWFQTSWPKQWPIQIIMEGIEDDEIVTFPRGTPVEQTVFKCILDPIDGTRGLMYDKRSAWVLSALALQKGKANRLDDLIVAVMTEVPTTKQWRSDQISAVKGRGIVAQSYDCRDTVKKSRAVSLKLKSSRAKNCVNGFASFARFFPEGKILTSRIEEALWKKLYGQQEEGSPMIFEDQYISTGGQIYELLCGHDRLIVDIRPMVFKALRLPVALVCHPYDICTALILIEAGGIAENPLGGSIQGPLDTTSSISWVGYANEALARTIRGPLKKILKQELRLK